MYLNLEHSLKAAYGFYPQKTSHVVMTARAFNNGNITQIGSWTYDYDALNRLDEQYDGSTTTTITYDSSSNRLTTNDGSSVSYTYPSTRNRLIDIDSTSLTYDSAGNLTSYDTSDYTWNAAGQLEEVEISSSTVGTYTYDSQNRRVKKVAGANTTYYVYGMGGLLYGEYDASGDLIREYVYLNSEPIAQIDDTGSEVLTYLHTDHLGTPRFGTNTGGTQVWSYDYDAFGNATPNGSVTVNLRMAGQYYDSESGLFYNWNRYYDPETGRYISSDPIGLEGGMNTYNYAMASPIMYIDPEGLLISCAEGDYMCEAQKNNLLNEMRNSEGGANTAKHRARNAFNRCDDQKPARVCMPGVPQTIENQFLDSEGQPWDPDSAMFIGGHCSFRGSRTFRNPADGSQCTYMPTEEGGWALDDSSECMGTYDYTNPSISTKDHYQNDVWPHNFDKDYVQGITTVY